MMKRLLAAITMIAAVGSAAGAQAGSARGAQGIPELESVTRQRLAITRGGMYVLGSWAVANLLAGSIGYFVDPVRADFHLFNAGWNLVNLGLAAGSLLSARNPRIPDSVTTEIREQHRIEKILLVNVGLDVAYMTAGAFMAFGPFADEQIGQFGAALMIQGGFLFAFDIGLALRHSRHREYERLVH